MARTLCAVQAVRGQAGEPAAVSVQDVEKAYCSGEGVTIRALDRVSFNVGGGAMVAVMAPSGSGKSTLLHVIGGMDRPDAGTITVGDFVVSGLSRRDLVAYRRRVGFVFQQFHLLGALSALQNVLAPLMPYHPSREDRQRAADLLEVVGLTGRGHDLPSQLSGGEQQRVAIARALVNRPMLLLGDEPTGNLDSKNGAEVIGLFRQAVASQGVTALIATHDARVADACDEVLRLLDGRLVEAS